MNATNFQLIAEKEARQILARLDLRRRLTRDLRRTLKHELVVMYLRGAIAGAEEMRKIDKMEVVDGELVK